MKLNILLSRINMKLTLLVFGLAVLLSFDQGYGRPLDDENNGKLVCSLNK